MVTCQPRQLSSIRKQSLYIPSRSVLEILSCTLPHGRFVLIAGFGNLAGQMDIYDLEKDFAKISTIEASNASVCEWSPDGRHILTATISPRLRVDNGIRIWYANGPPDVQ